MKKMSAKIISLVLTAVVALSCLTLTASAKDQPLSTGFKSVKNAVEYGDFDDYDVPEYVDTIEINNVLYDLFDDYTATVYSDIDYEGEKIVSGDVAIPSTVKYESEKYTVDTVQVEGFSEAYNLESIALPKTIVYVGDYAFSDCDKLENVLIPETAEFNYFAGNAFNSTPFACYMGEEEGVYTFGTNVLYSFNKPSATTYTIPSGITFICDYAFMASNLKTINISSSVKYIGTSAFANCTNLTNVVIPDSVTEISNYAFAGCTALSSITLGKNVEFIGEGAFSETAITTFNITANVIGCEGAFMNCQKLKYFTVDKANSSFYVVDSVLYESYEEPGVLDSLVAYPVAKVSTSFTLNKRIDFIEEGAFYGAKNLKTVNALSDEYIVSNSAFENSSVTNIDFTKFAGIGEAAFRNCVNIESANLENAWEVQQEAFSECVNLKTINFSNDINYIGSSVIKGTLVESVSVSGDGCYIEERAFAGCSNLKEVALLDGVASLGADVFAEDEALETVYLSETIEYVDEEAFRGCDNDILFKVIKRSEAYKVVKKNGLNYEIVGEIPLSKIIIKTLLKWLESIFGWLIF